MSEMWRKKCCLICSIIIVFLFAFGSSSSGANAKEKHGNNHYYFHDKLFQKTHTFKPKDREMMVSFSSEYKPSQMRQIAGDDKLTSIHVTEKKRFGVYKLTPSAVSRDETISKIRKHPAVLSAIPVMIDQEGIERYFIPHEFTVRFKDGIPENKMHEIIAAHGCQIIRRQRTRGYFTLAVPRGKMDIETSHGKTLFEIIREFIALEEVKFAEPSYIAFNMLQNPFYPNDMKLLEQWNLDDTGQYDHLKTDPNIDADINAPEAWEIERGNSNVVIVLIDSGIDMNHEDLVANLLPREGEDWDFSDDLSRIPYDEDGHGTSVAGIAAAVANNINGVAGIAHGCKIMPLKADFNYGNGQDLVDAINYAAEFAERHPQFRLVINCSWTVGPDITAFHDAIVNIKDHNIFICFCSGNDNMDDVPYPARYKEVIAVGAMSPCNERKSNFSCDGEDWWGSNYGPELDIVAPGVFIRSSDITGVGGYNEQGNYTDSFGGTSSACPHVAGLAALLLSKYRNMSANDVGDTIKLNAKDIAFSGWDEGTGMGKIDAFKALSNPASFIKFETDIQSTPPNQDIMYEVYEISKPGASAIRIHFSKFIMDPYSDSVVLCNANSQRCGETYNGNLGSFTSYVIPGDSVMIELVMNRAPNNYGFIIDYYECSMKNVYVDCNAPDTGTNDGKSWENAFLTIQGAIDDPETINGSTIWVAEGTYLEKINFKGKSIALLSVGDPNKTIIDANRSGTVITLNSGEGIGTIINGFTVRGGNSTQGGGIYCSYTSPRIVNCIVKENFVTYFGGGIFCGHSSAQLYNCVISGNSNYTAGGGLFCDNSQLRVENCTISGNSAYEFGGGFLCNGSNLDIDNCVITGNSTTKYDGGGIYCSSSNLDLDRCTISSNTARRGAGMFISAGLPSIKNCTVFENSAKQYGGGLYFYCSSSDSKIINSTFYKNSAGTCGGGLYTYGKLPTITNCILWNDFPQEIYGSANVSYSDIWGGYSGIKNIDSDPLFVDPIAGDFHLQADSNCIDNADPNANGLPSTDKDGNPRIVNGAPDMGAHEFMTIHVYPGQSIQQAINNAANGSVIIVHPSQLPYFENINFRGKAITLRSTDPDDPIVVANTIIDGGSNDGVYSVVTFNADNGNADPGEGHSAVLNGFTLRHGKKSGIYCVDASPTISNCVISDNYSASGEGGGIYLKKSSPTLNNCIIANNRANKFGGGIFANIDSSPTIINCLIRDNSADSYGGGLYFRGSNFIQIVNCIISRNTTNSGGGGAYFDVCLGESQIVNSIFNANRVYSGKGGAIYNVLSSLAITNCILWGDLPTQDEIFDTDLFYSTNVNYSDVEVKAGTVYPGQGNINDNPLLIDGQNGDYHLQSNSPCINAGTDVENCYYYFIFTHQLSDYFGRLPESDKDGIPRPVGAAYDMGAYEFAGVIRHVPSEYSTIQRAINSASNWDVIIVEPGIYRENINPSAKAITIMSADPWDPEIVDNTIIDGDEQGTVVTFQSGEGRNTLLIGFTIQNGSATNGNGGGITCKDASSPTIGNCRIIENSATIDGGGVFCIYHSSPSMINCGITGNTAARYGGGVYCCNSSSPSMTNCTINENSSHGGGGVYCFSSSLSMTNCTINGNATSVSGGGVYFSSSSSPSMTNCTITGNTASFHGGGIGCYKSSPNITNCTITENMAVSYGGGLYCYNSSSPNMSNCTINRNSANYGGGFHCSYSSSPSMTNCTITGNEAMERGGGIYCYKSSSPSMTNCTINGNLANYGGGFWVNKSYPKINRCNINGNIATNSGGGFYLEQGSSLSITNCAITGNKSQYGGGINFIYSYLVIMNCTICGNSAISSGGAIYNQSTLSSTITNTILWDNSPDEISGSGNSPTVTYSDIQGGYSGIGNKNADPSFIDPGRDYHLQAGSPCIDFGTDIGAPSEDNDGVLRPQDGDGVYGAQWDMGAYEYVP